MITVLPLKLVLFRELVNTYLNTDWTIMQYKLQHRKISTNETRRNFNDFLYKPHKQFCQSREHPIPSLRTRPPATARSRFIRYMKPTVRIVLPLPLGSKVGPVGITRVNLLSHSLRTLNENEVWSDSGFGAVDSFRIGHPIRRWLRIRLWVQVRRGPTLSGGNPDLWE